MVAQFIAKRDDLEAPALRKASTDKPYYWPTLSKMADGRDVCIFGIASALDQISVEPTICVDDEDDDQHKYVNLIFKTIRAKQLAETQAKACIVLHNNS